MGSRTTTTLFDDIDGSTEDIRTVTLTLDGQAVELDLSQKNYDEVAKFLEPYIAAGRKTSSSAGSNRRRRASSSVPSKASDTQAVRAWAAENNIEVSSRGRISADVVAKYEAAQG